MNINSNHCSLQFEAEIKKVESWIKEKVFRVCGYSETVILDCLIQCIVANALPAYAKKTKIICKNECLPTKDTVIDFGKAMLEIGSGKIIISTKQLLLNCFDFAIHWMFCFLSILLVNRCSTDRVNAVLVYGIGEESIFIDGNDKRFLKYCDEGPVDVLQNGSHLFVESFSGFQSADTMRVTYSSKPLISLLKEVRLGFIGRALLLWKHIVLFVSYLIAVIRLPQLSLLAKEFAYSSISLALDKNEVIDSVILTCSNYTEQPIWIRGLSNARSHMLWYAQAWKPITYAHNNLESTVPNLRWIRVNTHWVWTISFANYLKELGLGDDIRTVGPILWYLPEVSTPDNGLIKITIFDVSPFSDEIALEIGQITNYHHPNNLFSFIRDLVSLKTDLENHFELPVLFCLKTKRGYKSLYDKAYFDYLSELDCKRIITLEDYSINLYSLISESNLVIAYPFTSATYIADMLNVPRIYYDPTKSIVRNDFADSKSLMRFANTPESLFDATINALNKTMHQKTISN